MSIDGLVAQEKRYLGLEGQGEGGERMAEHQKYTNQSKCRTIDVGSFTETI